MHLEGASQETLQLGFLISPKRQYFLYKKIVIKSWVVSVPADFATYLLLFHSFAARGAQKHFVDLPPLGRRDVGKTVSAWQRLAGKGSP